MQWVLDEWVVDHIMVVWLRAPKDIMNMGLVCREWYNCARRVLLNKPEARAVNTLTEAYRLGWPCVIAHCLSLPQHREAAEFPAKRVLEACLGKKRRLLRLISRGHSSRSLVVPITQ